MSKTLRVLIATAIVVGLGTVAFAVAATGHGPRATDVPVMVTSRPVTSAVTVVTAAALNATETAKAFTSKPPSAHSKPTGNSGKNTTSAKRTTTPPTAQTDGNSAPPSDVSVEVVRPQVHDDTGGGSNEHHGDTQNKPIGGGD